LAETKQIATLVLLTLLVAVSGLALINYLPPLLEGDVVVDEYAVTLYANGTLVEDYTYEVKVPNQHRMLFRSWDVPLSKEQLNRPYIQFLYARTFSSEQLIVYVKDFQGSVWIEDRFRNDPNTFGLVRSLAELNEVGVLKPSKLASGTYKIRYVFLLHPPLECDEDLCHLNLQLANKHLTYRNVQLIIEDVDRSVAVYPRPPPLKAIRDGNRAIFHGSSPKDELLEVEILFKRDVLTVLNGYVREVDNVKGLTTQANTLYLVQYNAAQVLRVVAETLAVLVPIALIVLYIAFGREKRFVVPKYLSTIPNKERKPWIVNLVFKGDAIDFDDNGFYATLLDLHMKGKIKLSSKDDNLAIQILDQTSDDIYERRALQFLGKISKNGVVDTDSTKEFAEDLTSGGRHGLGLVDLQRELNYLMRRAEPAVASQFMVSGRKRLLPIPLICILLLVTSLLAMFLLPNLTSILTAAVVTSIIPVIQSVIAVAFPSTLFGKWLGLSYKEKLEWESFRKFLSDLALMRKYASEDLSMWGEWLVCGTALGVGDAVVKAMKELNIQLPEANLAPHIPMLFVPITVVGLPSGRGAGGSGGGGFGSGGGFGGGGAGTR